MAFGAFWQALERRRSGTGRGLVTLLRVASTNDLAKRIIREYAAEGGEVPAIDIVAWEQTAGRGRGRRRWSSPSGQGVYATAVRSLAVTALETLPMRVAVALAETLDPMLDGRCRLRWPNDLLVDGRKLGGMLLEAVPCDPASADDGEGDGDDGDDEDAERERKVGVAIGFGINHGPDPAVFGDPNATSLGAESAQVAPALAALAADLLTAIDARLAASDDDAPARYRALSAHSSGDEMTVRLADRRVAGVCRGFDRRGFLRLETPDGATRTLPAGEVVVDER